MRGHVTDTGVRVQVGWTGRQRSYPLVKFMTTLIMNETCPRAIFAAYIPTFFINQDTKTMQIFYELVD